ncbi:MAG: hypothetical protein U9Q18_04240, partial [Caldisericota bacterium]|nr:hypothetical protein [Caldisericota bacterium]
RGIRENQGRASLPLLKRVLGDFYCAPLMGSQSQRYLGGCYRFFVSQKGVSPGHWHYLCSAT